MLVVRQFREEEVQGMQKSTACKPTTDLLHESARHLTAPSPWTADDGRQNSIGGCHQRLDADGGVGPGKEKTRAVLTERSAASA
jgi:hypothetical protein